MGICVLRKIFLSLRVLIPLAGIRFVQKILLLLSCRIEYCHVGDMNTKYDEVGDMNTKCDEVGDIYTLK